MFGNGPSGITIETLEEHATKFDPVCWGWMSTTPVNENCGKIVGGLILHGVHD